MHAVTITSFGYGHGPAPEAHIVLDLRTHFRDPHVDPALRGLTARDQRVRRAVHDTPGVLELVDATAAAVRAYLAGPSAGPVTVAVGCVGGRHRSGVVADTLRIVLDDHDIPAAVQHRDIDRPVIRR